MALLACPELLQLLFGHQYGRYVSFSVQWGSRMKQASLNESRLDVQKLKISVAEIIVVIIHSSSAGFRQ